jgi:hypothetical protein
VLQKCNKGDHGGKIQPQAIKGTLEAYLRQGSQRRIIKRETVRDGIF